MSSVKYHLGLWSFIALLSSQVAQCAGPLILQSQWNSNSLSSGLVPQSTYDGDDLINFDDMPTCVKKTCVPFDPTVIGCPAKTTKNCYCSSNFTWQCTFGEASCPYTLFWEWLAHICLAAPLDSLNTIPPCAKKCIHQTVISNSCGLFSWDCFCTNGVATSCLTTCTAKDKAKMETWRTEQCVVYENGPSPSSASSLSSPSASSLSSPSSSTTTSVNSTQSTSSATAEPEPKQTTTATSKEITTTQTAAPASATTASDQNPNSNTNTNNIIISGSERQRMPPSMIMSSIVLGAIVLQLLAAAHRRFHR